MTALSAQLGEFWQAYAALIVLVAGLVGVVSLLGVLVWARRTRKRLRPLALAVSMNLALLLNAEGMWEVLTEDVGLPKLFAGLVFAVFEILFLTATSLAAEQYRRTTVYEADGSIRTPGHPGSMLYVAALIAGISGVIVASDAQSNTEKLLRLAVPTVIFLMWWAALTAAGQQRRRSRFAYSPRRLAERWGWLIPDDDPDLVAMAAERQVRRMVVNYQRVSGERWPAAWWRSRLLKDARTASESVVAEVSEQLARIKRVMGLISPDARAVEADESRAEEPVAVAPELTIPARLAARERAVRVRERGQRRRVCVRHPRKPVEPVQVPREDPRSAQQKALVVRAVKAFAPDLSSVKIASITDLPASTVRGYLPRTPAAKSARINGQKHDLEEVNN